MEESVSTHNLPIGSDGATKRMRESPPSREKTSEGDDSEAERDHFKRILNSYLMYSDHFKGKVDEKLNHIDCLTSKQQVHLSRHREHLVKVKDQIDINQKLLCKIVSNSCDGIFENLETSGGDDRYTNLICKNSATQPSTADMDRVTSVLRQLVREWASEGEVERNQSFGSLIEAVKKYLDPSVESPVDRSRLKIIVPGAGLGRLPYELASEGFSTQGNEYSMFMLIASHFILNRCPESHTESMVPWIHQSCNNRSSDDQMRLITIPDISATSIHESVEYSMTAGNFIEIYSDADQASAWDAVVTCFFIDTGHNVLDYIETIHHTLKPGGYWFNLGPLLYHFADMSNEKSIELSYNELREIILANNFTFCEEDTNVKCLYTANAKSMLTYSYECIYFVLQKREC